MNETQVELAISRDGRWHLSVSEGNEMKIYRQDLGKVTRVRIGTQTGKLSIMSRLKGIFSASAKIK